MKELRGTHISIWAHGTVIISQSCTWPHALIVCLFGHKQARALRAKYERRNHTPVAQDMETFTQYKKFRTVGDIWKRLPHFEQNCTNSFETGHRIVPLSRSAVDGAIAPKADDRIDTEQWKLFYVHWMEDVRHFSRDGAITFAYAVVPGVPPMGLVLKISRSPQPSQERKLLLIGGHVCWLVFYPSYFLF